MKPIPNLARSMVFRLLVALTVILPFVVGAAEARIAGKDVIATYLNPTQHLKAGVSVEEAPRIVGDELDKMKQAGIRQVWLYVNGTDGAAYYDSQIVPKKAYPKFDPVVLFMAAAKSRGIEVWPTLVLLSCRLENGGGILATHPEWALRNKEGKPLGHISPANPEARKWLVSVMGEVIGKYHPKGLVLDYGRYPNEPSNFDPASETEFKKLHPDAATLDRPGVQPRQSYKEEKLTELIAMISAEARKQQPGLILGIYNWGPHVTAKHYVSQAWPKWVDAGYLDLVNMSGYCFRETYGDKYLTVYEKRLTDSMALAKQCSKPVTMTFALGIRTSHGVVNQASEIGDFLRIARKNGVDGVGIFTWSYFGKFADEVERAGYLRGEAR